MIDYCDAIKKTLPVSGLFDACYAFSIHKAGSSLMNAMIEAVCSMGGIPASSIPEFLFTNGVRDEEWASDQRLLELAGDGYINYGFRYLPDYLSGPGSKVRDRRCVLLLRDPRDSLVSQYFSFSGNEFSHILPKKNNQYIIEMAERSAGINIDDYVISEAPALMSKIVGYRDKLNFEKTLCFKYEEVYYDKICFLEEIFNHFQVEVSADLLRRVAVEHDVRPENEDRSKHIRQGLPGDHRRKLKIETISWLSNYFRGVYCQFGYRF